MSNKFMLLLCAVLLLLVSSCGDSNVTTPVTIKGSGNLETYEIVVSGFQSILFAAVGDVIVVRGAEESVSMIVDDNVEQYIIVSVTNQTLSISSDPSVNLSEYDLTVTVTMPEAESFVLTGVGNITSDDRFESDVAVIELRGVGNIILDLDVARLTSTHSGVGNLILEGRATSHLLDQLSVGNVVAFELETDTTFALLSGIGNAQVHANDYLDVRISGSGSLFYRGQPDIVQVITGPGDVIDAN